MRLLDTSFLIVDKFSNMPSMDPFTIDFAISENDFPSLNDESSCDKVVERYQKLNNVPALFIRRLRSIPKNVKRYGLISCVLLECPDRLEFPTRSPVMSEELDEGFKDTFHT